MKNVERGLKPNIARGSMHKTLERIERANESSNNFDLNIRESPEGLVRLLEEDVLTGVSVAPCVAHPNVVSPIGQHVGWKRYVSVT